MIKEGKGEIENAKKCLYSPISVEENVKVSTELCVVQGNLTLNSNDYII